MADRDSSEPATPPQRVGVRELRSDLTSHLRRAREGTTFLVTVRDEVIAELRPPTSEGHRRRRPGAMRGRIRMASDFDTVPANVLAAMEGDAG